MKHNDKQKCIKFDTNLSIPKNKLTILGIETSCDDTCVAILRENECLSNIISSQDHNKLGGIFPEHASRQHLDLITPSINAALLESNIALHDIDAVAVTTEPGLQGSLIVGQTYSQMLAYLLNKPLIKVNHLHGHILSVKYACNLSFPYGFLLISGGHSMLGIAWNVGHYEILGRTLDDAAGECFDKVARSMGLEQPWGPLLEQHAKQGSANIDLPMPLNKDKTCQMSFSGLKTACIQKMNTGCNTADLACSFQNTVGLFLKSRIQNAIGLHPNITNWGIIGGVAANQTIRRHLNNISSQPLYKSTYNVWFPPINLCTDNALMIAYACKMQMQNP